MKLDSSWDLDHGTWSVLGHVYPDADVPVVQLSIDENRPRSLHFEAGKKFTPLRDGGILIIGSGNLIRNLHAYAWGKHMPEPCDWVLRFENKTKNVILVGEFDSLVDYERLGKDAELSVPTPPY